MAAVIEGSHIAEVVFSESLEFQTLIIGRSSVPEVISLNKISHLSQTHSLLLHWCNLSVCSLVIFNISFIT